MNESENIKRPLGVSILTIWLGLFAGLVPFVSSLVLLLNPAAQSEIGLSNSDLVFPIIWGIVVVVTAIGAWRGSNQMRLAFLIAITIHYTFIIFQNYQLMQSASSGLLDEGIGTQAQGRIIRGIFWTIVSWWYLNSSRSKPFFSNVKALPSSVDNE